MTSHDLFRCRAPRCSLLMGPLSIATGLAMSPALVNHFSRFGGRQTARSIHFVAMLGYVVFIVVHVTLVALTGFVRNMNHIVVGTDDRGPLGMILGFVGIGVVLPCWIVAHYVSWKHPRSLQHMQRTISLPLLLATFNRVTPQQRYRIDEVSPHLWPNGKMPLRDDWRRLAGRSLSRLSAPGTWSGREPRRTVPLGVESTGHGGVRHHAPLHSRLDRHRAMAGRADAQARRFGEADTGRARSPSSRLAKGCTAAATTRPSDWRTCVNRNVCWRLR